MRMMATPEGRVKARLNDRLKKAFGPNLFKFMPVQNGMGAPGLDYFCCLRGEFIAIETKVPGKDLTPRQKVTAALIQRAGGRVYEIRSDADIEALMNGELEIVDYSEFLPFNPGESNAKD